MTTIIACCALAGCGGAPEPANTPTPMPDLAPTPYPKGPFGNQPGEVLEDFTASGYRLSPQQRDSTGLPWEAIRLGDYHADARCKCLLITTGGVWCGACQQEQPALIAAVAADPGFCVLGVLQDGAREGGAASRQEVDEWTRRFQQNFPVVLGNGFTSLLRAGYGSIIPLPFNLIADPRTMRLLGEPVGGFDGKIYQTASERCGR